MGGDQLSRCAARLAIERPRRRRGRSGMVQSCAGLVSGNFQPFLEAVRGYEVMRLKSMFTKGEGERADS